MFEIGVFHNGASSLPVIVTKDGVAVNDGSLAEVHAAAQEVLVNQVRQGILAEKLGFQSFWLTEHHFQPEGAEMSPNPLLVQMAIAAQTKRIRLGQCANIVVWHHPVRLAEQIAQLDVISGGRVECGMGRGYQPRENETLGRPYGSTIQDQERNRKAFEEAVAIMQKCWTEPSFSHHGENFSVPPTYTKWNHKQTIAYFQMDKAGRRLEDVIAIGEPDMYSAGNPVQATTTTLKELQVFPQPVQKPHPQIWEPLTSARSIKWAAEHGINGVMIAEPNDRLKPEHRYLLRGGGKGRLARHARSRQVQVRLGRREAARHHDQPLHPHHHARQGEAGTRARRAGDGAAVRLLWPVRFRRGRGTAGRADVRPQQEGHGGDAARARDRDPRLEAVRHRQDHEDEEHECGYDDFCFLGWFELGGFEGREIEDQMQIFAEEVMPVIARECGGKVELPARGLDYVGLIAAGGQRADSA